MDIWLMGRWFLEANERKRRNGVSAQKESEQFVTLTENTRGREEKACFCLLLIYIFPFLRYNL